MPYSNSTTNRVSAIHIKDNMLLLLLLLDNSIVLIGRRGQRKLINSNLQAF